MDDASLSFSLSLARALFVCSRCIIECTLFVEQERGECRERKVVVGVAFLLLLLVQKRRRDDPRPVSRRDSRFPGVDPLPFRLVQLLVARFPSEAFVQRTPGVSTRPRDRHRSAFHALVVVSLVRRALREREFFHDGDQSFFFLLEHARPVVGRRATRVHISLSIKRGRRVETLRHTVVPEEDLKHFFSPSHKKLKP